MKKKLLYALLIFLFPPTIWAHLALECLSAPPPPPEAPLRIISLAPSISETLYALGLGDRVVGVTRFCVYPPEVKEKPKVAGFSDVNYEAVLRLRPDLVVLPDDKSAVRKDLEHLGLSVMTLDSRTLNGFMQDVLRLGESTGRQEEAGALLADLRHSIIEAKARAEGKRAPRVLFAVMHSYEGLGKLTEIHAIGKDGFYNELIAAAGGENAYTGDLDFPRLSREAIIFLNPDVIIDVIPTKETDLDAVRRDWQSLGTVRAVKSGRLHLFTDEGDTVPGPRSHKTVERLSRAFYPENP